MFSLILIVLLPGALGVIIELSSKKLMTGGKQVFFAIVSVLFGTLTYLLCPLSLSQLLLGRFDSVNLFYRILFATTVLTGTILVTGSLRLAYQKDPDFHITA